MSNFIDELRKTSKSKNEAVFEMKKFFSKHVDELINLTINNIMESIKSDILKKSKAGNYIISNNKKYISGNLPLKDPSYDIRLTQNEQELIESLCGEVFYVSASNDKILNKIKQLFISENNLFLHYDGEYGARKLSLGCKLLDRFEKKYMFQSYRHRKHYNVYQLTTFAQRLLDSIATKMREEGIDVEFSHIDIEGIKIPNGGNDKELKTHYISVEVMIKYSIAF